MPSLLSETDITEFNSAFQDIHDTWKRPITIFKEAKRIVVATNPNYSNIYRRSQEENSLKTEVLERVIEARIHYAPRNQGLTTLNVTANDQLNLDVSNSNVRIKVTKEDFKFFEGVQRFVVDGFPFELDSVPRPHGIVNIQFYSLFLKRLD